MQEMRAWLAAPVVRQASRLSSLQELHLGREIMADHQLSFRFAKTKTPLRQQETRRVYKNALRRGDVPQAQSCEDCGTAAARLHGHHPDYFRPLHVEWLCSTCHSAAHRPVRNFWPDPYEDRLWVEVKNRMKQNKILLPSGGGLPDRSLAKHYAYEEAS